MYTIYSGQFLSRSGVTWQIDLLRQLDAAPDTVGTLTFPSEEPLTIEWDDVERWEVIQGSSATLKIISPGDRTYADLYAIAVGEIRMDVYRNGLLFWSGTLDTEFYEEPYESASGYEVSITFSDLGVLDRLKYDLAGLRTLHELLSYAATRAGLGHLPIEDTTYISLKHTYGAFATPDTISIASDNFYDEDGEPSTLKEVVDGILQPLSLRIMQREGRLWVYDLYQLQASAGRREVYWTADSQTMGVAPVVNNVVLTFSPYAKQKPLANNLTYDKPYDPMSNDYHLDTGYHDSYAYYPACDGDNKTTDGSWDYSNISFRLWQGSGKGLASSRYGYFKIEPVFGGSSAEGSPFAYKVGTIYNNNDGATRCAGNFFPSHLEWLRSHRFFLPKLDATGQKRYLLKLSLPMLMDGRYNPFTTGRSGNLESRNEDIGKNMHHVYAAVDVHLYANPTDTTPAMHWSNRDVANEATNNPTFNETLGEWKEGADGWRGNNHDGWLDYYDKENYSSGSPVGKGWITNRQCLGTPRPTFAGIDFSNVKASVTSRDDGQYILYPPMGGWIDITLYLGIWPMKGGATESWYPGVSVVPQGDIWTCLSWMRWLLAKAPEVEIVDTTLSLNGIEQDDLEYRGTINPAAKDEVTIDTICGSAPQAMPTSRGCYMRTSDGLQLSKLTRGALTDHPERILIGTIYGQAAQRKTTLSGEARIEVGGESGLLLYTDQNQPNDRLFLATSEVLDAQSDTTELNLTELSTAIYIPEENNQ